MELIKKTVLQALTTGTTTGCTGTCRIIIPDLTANYYLKICLTQETQDIGFFDMCELCYTNSDDVYGVINNDEVTPPFGKVVRIKKK